MPLLTEFAGVGLSSYGFTRGGAAAGAYELISSTILSSSATTITFSSIPSTYKHLQIRFTARATSGSTSVIANFNSDSGSNYATHALTGDGSAVTSTNQTSQTRVIVGRSASSSDSSGIFAPNIVDILDYANTSKNKTTRAFIGSIGAATNINLRSGLWMNTAAISTIALTQITGGNDFASGSRFSLYGIKG